MRFFKAKKPKANYGVKEEWVDVRLLERKIIVFFKDGTIKTIITIGTAESNPVYYNLETGSQYLFGLDSPRAVGHKDRPRATTPGMLLTNRKERDIMVCTDNKGVTHCIKSDCVKRIVVGKTYESKEVARVVYLKLYKLPKECTCGAKDES